ncbi:MAG: family 16 glycosylhydrolase [Pseudomonadota bacterium]
MAAAQEIQEDHTPATVGFVETFDAPLATDDWFLANFDIESRRFLTSWRQKQITQNPPSDDWPHGGSLTLALEPRAPEADKPFYGAEVQRKGFLHYGRYEVVMTAAVGSGIVSSFFTYTGPHFGDPHDEIDIEFLGKDTRYIWLNRFVDGEGLHTTHDDLTIPLDFNAAEEPRLYGFDWREDAIIWYLDGEEIHRVTSDEVTIPTTPGKLMINIWVGNPGQAGWTGPTPQNANGTATYYCMSYRPFDDDGEGCSEFWAGIQQ